MGQYRSAATQFLGGCASLAAGYAQYVLYRPWEEKLHVPFIYADRMMGGNLENVLHNLPNVFGGAVGWMPDFFGTTGPVLLTYAGISTLEAATGGCNPEVQAIIRRWKTGMVLAIPSIYTGVEMLHRFGVPGGTYDPQDILLGYAGGALVGIALGELMQGHVLERVKERIGDRRNRQIVSHALHQALRTGRYRMVPMLIDASNVHQA